MPAFIGDTEIGSVFVGDTEADKVYLGDTEIWSKVAAQLDITIVGVSNAAGQTNGTTGTGTVPVTPTLPAGTQVGDRVYIFGAAVFPFAAIAAGWSGAGGGDAGTTFPSAGAGIRRGAVWWRDYDGVWTMPTISTSSASNSSNWVGAVAVRPGTGYALDVPRNSQFAAAYNSATTAYTDSSNPAGAFQTEAGGLLFAATVTNDPVTVASGGAISQTGATFDAVNKLLDGQTNVGFDVGGKVFATKVLTGATATVTHTMTLSAASQGETLFVHQTQSFVDDTGFSDNFAATLDTDLWMTRIASGVAQPFTTGGVLRLNTSGNAVWTKDLYDLSGGGWSFVFQAPASTTNRTFLAGVGRSGSPSALDSSITRGAAIGANGSSLFYRTYLNGTLTNIGAFGTHTAGNWYRIRESGGTIFYDMAPNSGGSPGTWTNQRTATISDPPMYWRAFAIASGPTTGAAMDLDNFTLTL